MTDPVQQPPPIALPTSPPSDFALTVAGISALNEKVLALEARAAEIEKRIEILKVVDTLMANPEIKKKMDAVINKAEKKGWGLW